MSINVIIAGPRGKMGSEAVQMVTNSPGLKLVACLDRTNNEIKINDINIPVFDNPETCFQSVNADVFVDLTVPEVGYKHTKTAIQYNLRTVIGTTGFTEDQLNELSAITKDKKLGCIIAPNFAIGAVLMMQFAKTAAKYFPDVEIIEKHHDNKLDAPSGTAKKTAALIKETRIYKKQGHEDEMETIKGARGGELSGIRIHSVRLPGLVAHQEVIFGGSGQTLTIKHDSYNRGSFMEGINLSIEKVMNLDGLIYGLENIL